MFRNRRSYATRLTMLAFTLTGLIILVWLGAPLIPNNVSAQTPQPSPSPTPWQTDPMGNPGNYTLFRNDNLFIAGAAGTPCYKPFSYYNQQFTPKPGPTLDGNGFVETANFNQQSIPDGERANWRIAGGAGRILTQTNEQGVIYKLLDYSGSGQATYYVSVFDKSGIRWEHQFPAIPASVVSHLDVAVGDLDGLRDASGEYQDEVVLVSESGGATTQVTVISFKDFDQKAAPQITTFDTGVPVGYYKDPSIGSGYNRGGQVAVAAGDFNGDGRMEFVASTVSNSGDVYLSVFRYTNDGQNSPQITMTDNRNLYDKPYKYDNTNAYQYADIAAGDFNGSGRDQVMIGLVAQRTREIWVTGYDFDDDLTMHSQYASTPQALGLANNNINGNCNVNTNCGATINQEGWVQLKAGLFKFDPANGYGMRGRQLGIMFGNARPVVGILEVPPAKNNEIQWLPNAGAHNLDDISGDAYGIWRVPPPHPDPDYPTSFFVPDVREAYTLMAGNFGAKDANNPAWQLAAVAPYKSWAGCFALSHIPVGYSIAAWQYTHRTDAASPYSFSLQNLAVPSDVNQLFGINSQIGRNVAAVALDSDGKAMKLGAPMRFSVDGVVKSDFIIHEPPKHAYWDNGKFGAWSTGKTTNTVQNVNRLDAFNIELANSDKKEFSSSSKDTTEVSVGGSIGASYGTSGGVNGGLLSAKVSVDASLKIGYDYDSNKETYNANNSERTVTLKTSTDEDDSVQGRFQSFDIWRYRVYGTPATDEYGNALSPFYDLVLPGGTHPFSKGGMNLDWYQPVHENGNILSYPGPSNGTFSPSDLGAYRVPCPSKDDKDCVPCKLQTDAGCSIYGTKLISTPMVDVRAFGLGGNGFSQSLDYSNTIKSGGSFTYSNTLSDSAEVKVAYQAKLFVTESHGSVSLGFHNKNSWGNTKTSDSTQTNSTGITLNLPSMDALFGYDVYPTFYTAQDGTIKAAHAVNVLGSNAGQGFWKDLYAQRPDPALNLPLRFHAQYSDTTNLLTGWNPNPSDARKMIRGFFLTKSDKNPVTNDYDYLAQTPQADDQFETDAPAGDRVRVVSRVFNYSIAEKVSDMTVQFQVVSYDNEKNVEVPFKTCPNTRKVEWANPVRGRCIIGQQDGIDIEPWPNNVATAFTTWDTTGFGPATAGSPLAYRVYVVLDPEDKIKNETYESEDPTKDYQCKNLDGDDCELPQGVDPGQNNEGWGLVYVTHPSASAAPLAEHEADVALRPGAIVAGNRRGQIRTGKVAAEVNRPLALRVRVDSDRAHRGIGHLLVYDGDPAKGGQMIAGKLVHTGNTNGSYVWFDWIPRQLGRHKLYARVLERGDDARRGNHTDSLVVNVRPPDKRPPQLQVVLTPNQLGPANGRMVEVVATILVQDNQDPQPDVRLEAITHNEAYDAGNDVAGAEFGTDDRQFALRAARTGRREEPRVYKVVYSATDWAGNKTFAETYVTVPHRR